MSDPSFAVEPEEAIPPIHYLSAPALADATCEGPFVVVVRTAEEFLAALVNPWDGCEAIEVVHLLGDAHVWSHAAQGGEGLPLDVVLHDPAVEYSLLYRLADVRLVRPVRVTIPALPGLLKAVRLAASMQLPVRLLPGQPSPVVLEELCAAAEFYLRDGMVEAPIEFFHSAFAVLRGMAGGTLWDFLEENPAFHRRPDETGGAARAADFVETHLNRLLQADAECVDCRWRELCAGYFKLPDPAYGCEGVKGLFSLLAAAAAEISADLGADPTEAVV